MQPTVLAESIGRVLYTLRNYQLEAVEAAMQWMRKNSEPALLELSGGAGKSIICAEIARRLFQMTGKRVLCLVPNQDLLLQNGEKMALTGEKFSYYSASVSKSLRHHIVIATEGTFKSIAKEKGSEFCAVIVDEAHRVTATFKNIIADMQEANPMLRVIGMTGTPFRMRTGYIYELDTDNRIIEDAIDPFYKKLLYRITCNELIAMSYLTPIVIGEQESAYDTDSLVMHGEHFTNASIKKTFEDNSITSSIVSDIVEKSRNRKGVMIFCSSIKHCQEVMKYLPEGQAVMVEGGMSSKERKKAIADFKAQKYKYIVNRDILTTGFDAPHVDCIALMRATESNGLFQQILWRGVRLFEGKLDCLLLDYGRNIEKLFNGDPDIFTPQIKTYGTKPQTKIEVSCPECGTKQEHSKRPKYEQWDDFGYAVDLAGDVLEPKIPAHYGRRCLGVTPLGKNKFKRCDYFWAHKECPSCAHKNDIAARECEACGLVLIDPNAKLSEQAIVIKQGEKYTTNVNALSIKESTNGGVMYAIFDTPHGEIKAKFYPNNTNRFVAQHANIFNRATECGEKRPTQIEYSLKKDGFYVIHRYIPPFVEN